MPQETTVLAPSCFSTSSYWQPFRCHRNDSKIEIKGPFGTEEKHPYCFQAVTGTSEGTNVTANGAKQEPQTVSMEQPENLVACSADSLRQIPKSDAIAQNLDAKTENLVTVPSCLHNSDPEELVITDGDQSDGLIGLSRQNIETNDATNTRVNSSGSRAPECTEETTAPDLKHVPDVSQTEGPVVSTVESEGLTNKKPSMAADSPESVDVRPVMAERENADQAEDTESKKQYLDSIARLLKGECEVEFPVSYEDTEVTKGKVRFILIFYLMYL